MAALYFSATRLKEDRHKRLIIFAVLRYTHSKATNIHSVFYTLKNAPLPLNCIQNVVAYFFGLQTSLIRPFLTLGLILWVSSCFVFLLPCCPLNRIFGGFQSRSVCDRKFLCPLPVLVPPSSVLPNLSSDSDAVFEMRGCNLEVVPLSRPDSFFIRHLS